MCLLISSVGRAICGRGLSNRLKRVLSRTEDSHCFAVGVHTEAAQSDTLLYIRYKSPSSLSNYVEFFFCVSQDVFSA
jgi:hypothetical protein